MHPEVDPACRGRSWYITSYVLVLSFIGQRLEAQSPSVLRLMRPGPEAAQLQSQSVKLFITADQASYLTRSRMCDE